MQYPFICSIINSVFIGVGGGRPCRSAISRRRQTMKLISVVVPCYNEQEVLPMFYDEIIKVSDGMKKEHSDIEFEFLFINDGSKDRTLEIFRELADKDERVRYISFSRNFGKEPGMYAGLKNAKGDFVVVMDADLQHPPAFLPQMYNYVKDGEFDCATTRRVSRTGESKIRSFFARMFYKIMNKISPENFDLHTMLSLTGVDNSFCTGMPGLLISWAFEIVFFFSVTLCAMGIMGLFYKIPPRAGMVLWFAGIIGFNALIWFGDDLKIGMPSGMAARLAMMIGALVTGAVLSVYCYGSCDMRAAQPETV